MTEVNTPSPDEDRELIAVLHGHANNCETEGLPKVALHFRKAADRIESLLSDRAKLEEALREVRRILKRHNIAVDGMHPDLWEAYTVIHAALNRSTDRAT